MKIYNIDEYVLQDDLSELVKRLDATFKPGVTDFDEPSTDGPQVTSSNCCVDSSAFIDPNSVSGA